MITQVFNKPNQQEPTLVSCWLSDAPVADPITVAITGPDYPANRGYTYMLAMGYTPFHPQGFCQHTEGMPGPHLGTPVRIEDLPPDCQKVVHDELWG